MDNTGLACLAVMLLFAAKRACGDSLQCYSCLETDDKNVTSCLDAVVTTCHSGQVCGMNVMKTQTSKGEIFMAGKSCVDKPAVMPENGCQSSVNPQYSTLACFCDTQQCNGEWDIHQEIVLKEHTEECKLPEGKDQDETTTTTTMANWEPPVDEVEQTTPAADVQGGTEEEQPDKQNPDIQEEQQKQEKQNPGDPEKQQQGKQNPDSTEEQDQQEKQHPDSTEEQDHQEKQNPDRPEEPEQQGKQNTDSTEEQQEKQQEKKNPDTQEEPEQHQNPDEPQRPQQPDQQDGQQDNNDQKKQAKIDNFPGPPPMWRSKRGRFVRHLRQ